MLLLDLPPEIFENVVHELVCQAGVVSAWNLRGVSRTFLAVIKYEIFANQPRESFGSNNYWDISCRERNILNKNIGLYLYYHTKRLLDTHDNLPKKMFRMVDYLAEELHMRKKAQREQLLQNVCDGLGMSSARHEIPFNLWHGTGYLSRLDSELAVADKLTAAISQGAVSLIPPLLLHLHDDDVYASQLPLNMAAVLGHVKILESILDRSMALESKAEKIAQDIIPQVNATISASIFAHQMESARFLTDWYTQHLPPLVKKTYSGFLKDAIRANAKVEMFKLLLDVPFKNVSRGTRVTRDHFAAVCAYGRADIMKLFVDDGHFDPNDSNSKIAPLIFAVRSKRIKGSDDVVKVLLDAGANVDATYSRSLDNGKVETRSSIEIAVKKKNLGLVQCLLDAGASVPDPLNWPRHRQTFELLREARMQENGREIPGYKKFKKLTEAEVRRL